MPYDHAQRNDADYYDGQEDSTHCDECGQLHEGCTCVVAHWTPESEPPTSEELWAAYNKSQDEKDLPF